MPRKSTSQKKSSTKKKSVRARTVSVLSKSDKEAIDKLLRNSIELQKTSLNLIEASNRLNEKMGKLIGLFEEAAKNVGVIEDLKIKEETKSLTEKLDELLQQNKDLARGLLLLEQYVRGKTQAQSQGIKRLEPKPLPLE
jgi:hypothetical protein